jgi:hypothetical protein
MVTRRRKKKNNTGSILAIAGTVALIAFVLSQQKTPPVETTEPEPVQVIEQPEPEVVTPAQDIPPVFSDEQKQEQFEVLYSSYQSVFLHRSLEHPSAFSKPTAAGWKAICFASPQRVWSCRHRMA